MAKKLLSKKSFNMSLSYVLLVLCVILVIAIIYMTVMYSKRCRESFDTISTTPSTPTPYASITCYLTLQTNDLISNKINNDETNTHKYYFSRLTNMILEIQKTNLVDRCKYTLEFVDNFNFRIYSIYYQKYLYYFSQGQILFSNNPPYYLNSNNLTNTFNILTLNMEFISFENIDSIKDGFYICPSGFKSTDITIDTSYIIGIVNFTYYGAGVISCLLGFNINISKISATYAVFNIEPIEIRKPTIVISPEITPTIVISPEIIPTIQLIETTTPFPTTTSLPTTTVNRHVHYRSLDRNNEPITTIRPTTTAFLPTTTAFRPTTTIRPFITIPKDKKIKLKLTISSVTGSPMIRLANFTNINATNININGSGYDIKNILTNNNITGTSWRSTSLNTTNYIQIETNDEWNRNKSFTITYYDANQYINYFTVKDDNITYGYLKKTNKATLKNQKGITYNGYTYVYTNTI